jgi:Domain of unknown function (DUF4157)
MAQHDDHQDGEPELSELTPEERLKLQRESRERARAAGRGTPIDAKDRADQAKVESGPSPGEELTDELTRRWDPQRLSKLVATKAGKSEGLDSSTRSRYEGRFGVDLSKVRIITGAFAQEFTAKHNAEAITVGASGMILMRQSEHFSGMAQRESLLAHELTHVAQAAPGFHNKKTSSVPFGSDESEAEAEEHEAAAKEEAEGGGHDHPDPEAGDKDEARTERLVTLVMELAEEDARIQALRSGDAG